MKDSRSVIRRPLITEKGSRLQETANQYLFEVAMDANKQDVKRAIEEVFSVKVTKVNTARTHGKLKRLGRFSGHRPDRKRATVTLAEGQRIQFFEEV